MNRDSFIFYRSFYDSIKELPDNTQLEVLKAIIEYSLNGKEVVEFSCPVSSCLFQMAKPQIDANTRRWSNGLKGGAPKGNKNAKKKDKSESENNHRLNSKNNQKQPSVEFENNQKQPNVNDNVNVNDNNINNNISETAVSVSTHPEATIDANLVANYFNYTCGQFLPQIQKVTEARRRNVKNRTAEYGKEAIKIVIDKTKESDFLSGRSGAWNGCSFDWIFTKSNFIKILEGNYDNKAIPSAIQSADDKRRSFEEGLRTAERILAEAAKQNI